MSFITAHKIPKIEYLNSQVYTGVTYSNASAVLTGFVSTTDIVVGSFIRSAVNPLKDNAGVNYTVLSKTTTTVTLNANFNINQTTTFESFFLVDFEFPPIENSVNIDPQERTSKALSGQRQVSIDYIEEKRSLVFSHLRTFDDKDGILPSFSTYSQLKSFYDNYAKIGSTFRYFDDKTTGLTGFNLYDLDDLKWNAKIISHNGSDYVYSVPMKLRRVL